MSLTIRHAKPDDVDLLANLGRQTYSDTFSAQNTPETMALYLEDAFSPQKQAAELADPATLFLIAEDEGKPVGYARLKEGHAPECVTGQRPIEIIRFYAVKEYIGHGLGAILMTACLEEAVQSKLRCRLAGCMEGKSARDRVLQEVGIHYRWRAGFSNGGGIAGRLDYGEIPQIINTKLDPLY